MSLEAFYQRISKISYMKRLVLQLQIVTSLSLSPPLPPSLTFSTSRPSLFNYLISCFVIVKRVSWKINLPLCLRIQLWPNSFLICLAFFLNVSKRILEPGQTLLQIVSLSIIIIVKVRRILEAVGGHENQCLAGLLTIPVMEMTGCVTDRNVATQEMVLISSALYLAGTL